MVDKSTLPKWLSRGIEEYFPVQDSDQTFAEKIDHANKNNSISFNTSPENDCSCSLI